MDINKIKAITQTLNAIEVKGKDNMEALLGCIWTLEGEIREQEARAAAAEIAAQAAPQEVTDG